jgi:hypothetical protein
MTQKDKIREAWCFAVRVKSIASSILHEGNDYDMRWHRGYVEQLNNACESIMKKLK